MVLCSSLGHAQMAPESTPTVTVQTVPAQTAPSQRATGEPEKAKKRRIPPIGPELEAIYLLDSKTRSRFGSTVLSIGPGIGSPIPPLKGKISPDFSILQAKERQNGFDNKLFVVSLGPQYKSVYIPRKFRSQAGRPSSTEGAGGPPTGGSQFGGGPPPFLPYYGIGLNAIYAKVKVPGDGLDDSGLGIGGSLMVGVSIKKNALIEARVRATSKIKGYSFSGVGLTFGLRF